MVLSITKMEDRGATIAVSGAIWLKRLLKDFNNVVNKPIPIHYDDLIIILRFARNV